MTTEPIRMTMDAAWAEALKARRSFLPRISALIFTIAAGIAVLFMFITQDPDRARSFGLLGTKAELTTGPAALPALLEFLTQITAIGGLVLFGIIFIWIFGREFTDATAKDLLALPTPRRAIVVAKLLVATSWCLALAIQLLVLGVLFALPLHLPGWSAAALARGGVSLMVTASLTALLASSFGLVASILRGYLSAVGTLFAAIFTSQILAVLGYGRYFPYSVPALATGMAGSEHALPGVLGHALTIALGLGSWLAVILWWQHADHPR